MGKVFVRNQSRILEGQLTDTGPRTGEVLLKAWKLSEAERTGTTVGAVNMRIQRGQYDHLHFRRVNKRIIYVLVANT